MPAPTTRSTIRARRPGSASLSQPDLLRPETWTSEAYRTFCRTIFAPIPNATSSPGSGAGATPSVSPAGPTTAPSGPVPARANLSARQAREAGLLTSGTYGRTSTGSSNSAALQLSLESKLQADLLGRGSTLFKMTWKAWVTPSGRQFCRLAASAPRTSGNACSSWPTAGAKDGDKSVRSLDGAEKEAARKGWTNDLCTAALSAWPTASARDWKGATHERWGTNARPLNEVARLAGWGTPNASSPGGTPEQALRRKEGLGCGQSVTTLDHQVQLVAGWATPTRQDGAGSRNETSGRQPGSKHHPGQTLNDQVFGMPSNGFPAGTEKPGQLNPAFSLWLMGFPAGWVSCGERAMQLCRKSPRRSSRPA